MPSPVDNCCRGAIHASLPGMPVEIMHHVFIFHPSARFTLQAVSRAFTQASHASLSGMPVEIMDHVFSFLPDTPLVLRAVSRAFEQTGKDCLQANMKEILALCSRKDSLLYCRITKTFFHVRTVLWSQPERIPAAFHRAIPGEIQSLGKSERSVCARNCPNRILFALEISRFNDILQNAQKDASLQRIWPRICAQFPETLNPHGDRSPADQMRAWIHANPARLQRVTDLRLDYRELTYAPPELGLFTNLGILDMSSNKLTSLQENLFQGFNSLRSLNLGHNLLHSLPVRLFRGLTALDSLYLGNNPLESLPERLFEGLFHLETLFLDHNHLRSLPEKTFQGLIHLRLLDLGNSQLHAFPEKTLQGLTGLRDLRLEENLLRSFPGGAFQGLTHLGEVRLANNPLVSLPKGLFQVMTQRGALCLDSRSGLLFAWDDMPATNDFFEIANRGSASLNKGRDFFNYECRSEFARFYQFAAGSSSSEAVRESFLRLPNYIKNAICTRVWIEAGTPPSDDPRWGHTHTFDNMQYFNGALKRYVKEMFGTLSNNQKNAVYGHIYTLAHSQNGAQDRDFNSPQSNNDYIAGQFFGLLNYVHPTAGRKGSPQDISYKEWQWGKNHAHDNIPRLIDAMMQMFGR